MGWQFQTQQAEKEVVDHLVHERPFLQDVVPYGEAQEVGKPSVCENDLVTIDQECAAEPNFDEWNEAKIDVNQGCWNADSQIALKQLGVIIEEAIEAEELADSGGEEDCHHHQSNDSLSILKDERLRF